MIGPRSQRYPVLLLNIKDLSIPQRMWTLETPLQFSYMYMTSELLKVLII